MRIYLNKNVLTVTDTADRSWGHEEPWAQQDHPSSGTAAQATLPDVALWARSFLLLCGGQSTHREGGEGGATSFQVLASASRG